MNNKTVLILGATSGIAKATAQALAAKGYGLHLAGRDKSELEILSQDLSIRSGAKVSYSLFDVHNVDSHQQFFKDVLAQCGTIYGALVAVGELGDQILAQNDPTHAKRIIDANFTGVVSLLTPIANYLEEQRQGFIVGISSVAGDRGRQSNYLYGSSKAGLSAFLSGLRNRLAKSNVQVLTVKPGFVNTKMTFGKQGMFLVAEPEDIAKGIVAAIEKRQNVIYLPWFWFWIMKIIRSIPEPIFIRMKM
jgi:short-subunit dehydrogenase